MLGWDGNARSTDLAGLKTMHDVSAVRTSRRQKCQGNNCQGNERQGNNFYSADKHSPDNCAGFTTLVDGLNSGILLCSVEIIVADVPSLFHHSPFTGGRMTKK